MWEPIPKVVADVDAILEVISREKDNFGKYAKGIYKDFLKNSEGLLGDPSVVHSVKYRLKSDASLRDKLYRKIVLENRDITATNVFSEITDIAGIRILHLHLDQLKIIDKVIRNKDWVIIEPPKAYSWDPETISFMEGLSLEPHFKASYYTSVHYVVRPNASSKFSCEIQVRTLFEEVWGEVDHALNYPKPSSNQVNIEQLKVLAKIVGAGTRLVDCIYKSI